MGEGWMKLLFETLVFILLVQSVTEKTFLLLHLQRKPS